jgi:hypothetical protein
MAASKIIYQPDDGDRDLRNVGLYFDIETADRPRKF